MTYCILVKYCFLRELWPETYSLFITKGRLGSVPEVVESTAPLRLTLDGIRKRERELERTSLCD